MANVLLVEDDVMNILIFRKVLEKRGGHQVTHSEDVPEILQLCLNGLIDLVVMDISLSNSEYEGQLIDGIEITRLIKNQAGGADIPVVLTTAHAMSGDEERFLSASGAQGYITKPIIDHEEFIGQISGYLDSAS